MNRLGHSLVVFFGTLGVYYATMPSTITLEDAGLFQLVCHLGGISHPPGYPLFTILCNGIVQSPGVIYGNLVSALFASLAVVCLHHITFRLTKDRVLAYLAAFGWGFSYTLWSQAIIIEVYTLAAFMFMVCWWLLIEFEATRENKFWYWACLAFGLALSNHWPLMILSSLGLVATISPAWKDLLHRCRSPQFVLFSVICVVVGLLPYVTLILNPDPRIGVFGGIDSISELVRYVTRSVYKDSHEIAGIADKLNYAGWLLDYGFVKQLGVALMPVVAGGVILSFYQLPRSVAWALILIFSGSTFILLGLVNFQYSEFYRAIYKPYPIIAFSSVALWFGLGARWIVTYVARLTNRQIRLVNWIISPILVASVLIVNYPRLDRSHRSIVDIVSRSTLAAIPPNAIVFTSGDDETGPIGYLHYVENIRPDIELRDWDNLVFDNRLMSPYGPPEPQKKARTAYINAAERPVVVIDPVIHPRADFGTYVLFNRAGGDVYAFLPELHALAMLLVDIYQQDLSLDDYERHYLNYVLSRFSEQYIGYALQQDGELDPMIAEGVARLQQTFPGRAYTLQELVKRFPEKRDRAKLVEMAKIAEQEIPTSAPREVVAIFYELYGRIVLLAPADVSLAQSYFLKSIDLNPAKSNPSNCLLMSSYRQEGNEVGMSELHARFAGLKCEGAGEGS